MDIKDHAEELRGVFIVYVRPHFNEQKSCDYLDVDLVTQEGYGESFRHVILNDRKHSIPVQIELWLMEINCLPTWAWYWDGREYVGQFANEHNYKTHGNFSAELHKEFRVIL